MSSCIYNKRLAQNEEYSVWDKIERCTSVGFGCVIVTTFLAIFVNLFHPFKDLSSLFFIFFVLLSSFFFVFFILVLPFVFFGLKLFQNTLLLKSFISFEGVIYAGGYRSTNLLKEFLRKHSDVELVWTRLALEQKETTWKRIHEASSEFRLTSKILWWLMWMSNGEGWPQEHPKKTFDNNKTLWEDFFGEVFLSKEKALQEKEILTETLPQASFNFSSKKRL